VQALPPLNLKGTNMAKIKQTTSESIRSACEKLHKDIEAFDAQLIAMHAKYTKLQEQREASRVALVKAMTSLEGLNERERLNQGDDVWVTLPKQDNPYAGTIVGVKTTEGGEKLFKVAYGSGFDANLCTVKVDKLRPRTPDTTPEHPAEPIPQHMLGSLPS
jgi:chromosome segregation ATPase